MQSFFQVSENEKHLFLLYFSVNFTYLLVAILNVTESQMKTCSNVTFCLPKFFIYLFIYLFMISKNDS